MPLLIIDDLGMRKLPHTAAEDLPGIVMRRYERASTLLTSNRPVDDWGKLLGDTAAVTALLDRLLRHASILKCGPTQRPRATTLANTRDVRRSLGRRSPARDSRPVAKLNGPSCVRGCTNMEELSVQRWLKSPVQCEVLADRPRGLRSCLEEPLLGRRRKYYGSHIPTEGLARLLQIPTLYPGRRLETDRILALD